jgi:hypothetical protein
MNRSPSLSATPPTEAVQNARAVPAFPLWVLAAAFTVTITLIAVAVLAADASLTPDQRFALFMQSGSSP